MRMSRFRLAAAAIALLASWPLTASAHSAVFDCHKEKDGSVACEAGFSDGSSAAGMKVRVMDLTNKVLMEGVLTKEGVYAFKPPAGKYHVMFDGGPGHTVTMDSEDIT
jgi:hypothetical protein